VHNPNKSNDWRHNLNVVARRFEAWWEGYAYDDVAQQKGNSLQTVKNLVPEEDVVALHIWGNGRLDPGNPAWTMRHARTLGVAVNAKVAVLGAGAGGPVLDLKSGARWKIKGYTNFSGKARISSLRKYEVETAKINRPDFDGALCFFDLVRDNDPSTFALFASELVKHNAPVSFVDFTTARPGRLSSCFFAPWKGMPRPVDETVALIESAGLRVFETVIETRSFLPLIAEGWSRWRIAYDYGLSIKDARARASYLRMLSIFAKLWAERLEALKAGQLQVTRFQTRRSS